MVDNCQPTVIFMARTRPYYSKRQIRNLIEAKKFKITENARFSAMQCFGWNLEDVKRALLLLPQNSCYKSEQRFDNPKIWVDYYRAKGVMGENVYTHFYVEDDNLIVDSFKEI